MHKKFRLRFAGERFVPGQIIDTEFGPRFVPGKISEIDGEVTFTPAQIVQTDQGTVSYSESDSSIYNPTMKIKMYIL